jgi:hypothetical protein
VELNLSDKGGGNLPEVAGHGGTWLVEGLDGGRLKGRRRKAMDWSEMVLGVARSSGIQLADRRRTGGSYPWQLDDSSHGGAMAVKGRRRKKVLHRGVLPFIGGRGGWKRWRELQTERWWRRSYGHGKAAAATVQTWSVRVVPLFGQGG